MSDHIPNIQIFEAPDIEKALAEAIEIKENIFKNLIDKKNIIGQIAYFVYYLSFQEEP